MQVIPSALPGHLWLLADGFHSQCTGLYAQDARISWNGNPFLGSDVSPFLSKLPRSRTEIQTMDAHPIPGEFLPSKPLVLS